MMKIDNLEIYDSHVYIFLLFLTEDEIWKMKFKFSISCSV